MTGCCSPSIMDLPSSSVLAFSGVTSSSAVQAQDTLQKPHAPDTPQAVQRKRNTSADRHLSLLQDQGHSVGNYACRAPCKDSSCVEQPYLLNAYERDNCARTRTVIFRGPVMVVAVGAMRA